MKHPAKNAPANSAITGHLCSARDESSEHCCCSSFSVITDSTACHDSRYSASCTDDDRDYGFSGKTYSLEDRVHYNADTRHVTAVFKKCDQEVHYHYQRQEAYYGTYTADDTISQYSLETRAGLFSS